MIVYKGRGFAVRRYEYGRSGIVDTIGSLLACYAIKTMFTTAAKVVLQGTLVAAKKAIPHVIAHELTTTIAKKQKRVDKGVTGSQEPQLKKASVDTGGTDINTHRRIWYFIRLTENDWRIYITTSQRQCCR